MTTDEALVIADNSNPSDRTIDEQRPVSEAIHVLAAEVRRLRQRHAEAVAALSDEVAAQCDRADTAIAMVREAHDAFLAVTVLAPEVAFNPMNLSGTAAGIVLSVRQRHAAAVEAAFREGLEYAEGFHAVGDYDAAWLASEAKRQCP